ncbi:type II toxin-antitoxin system TacA family antitoxin [Rhizobium sp. RAF56]|uniref:type II toxin-antitoxin system TacA family antitoxin n=1 Tax=Rhizobium sp. RAF56 TaxID=3233062 RepID=UPI003F95D23D
MEATVPRVAVEDNERLNLRIAAAAKAKLVRAAALRNTDLTNFVTQSSLREAEAVIKEAEAIKVSERDYLRILDLLENPPAPNEKLLAAALALPKSK